MNQAASVRLNRYRPTSRDTSLPLLFLGLSLNLYLNNRQEKMFQSRLWSRLPSNLSGMSTRSLSSILRRWSCQKMRGKQFRPTRKKEFPKERLNQFPRIPKEFPIEHKMTP